MSDEGEKTCPLCAEEMDLTDQQLKPCKCGYEICVWCWHHIMEMAEKDETEGRCPACRTPYDKERIVGTTAKCERLLAENTVDKKQKSQKSRTKTSESRKQLTSVRVIQRNLVYIVGLPLDLADEDLLQQKEYFGQYGKVLKVSISRTSAGTIQQFANNTCSVYITYSKEEDAVRCIQSVHGFMLDGRPLRACFGTTKYCHAWLRNVPCNNPDCLYLHEVGSHEDSFTKDEIISAYTRSRVQQITGCTNNMQRRSGTVLPPPADDYFDNSSPVVGKPAVKSSSNAMATSVRSSPPTSSSGRSGALPPAASWGSRASNCNSSAGNLLANSNGPTKQKVEVGGLQASSTTVSGSTQVPTLPNDGGKKSMSNEETHARQTKNELKVLEAEQHGVDSYTKGSDVSSTPPVAPAVKLGNQSSCPPAAESNNGENNLLPDTGLSVDNQPCSSSVESGISVADEKIQNLCSEMSTMSVEKRTKEHSDVIGPNGLCLDNFLSSASQGLQRHDSEKLHDRSSLVSPAKTTSAVDPVNTCTEVCDWRSDVQDNGIRGKLTPETEDDFDNQRLRDAIVVNQATMSTPSQLHLLSHLGGPLQQHADAPGLANYPVDTTAVNRKADEGLGTNVRGKLVANGFLNHFGSCAAGQGNSCLQVNVDQGNHIGMFDSGLANVASQSAVDLGESSIISNILDLDSWDDSLTSLQNLAEFLGETDKQDVPTKLTTSSRKGQISNQSRFSFARQEESRNNFFDFEPSLNNTGQGVKTHSFAQSFVDNREPYLDRLGNGFGYPQHSIEPSDNLMSGHSVFSSNKLSSSRSQIVAPPGFSVPNRPLPPPGFPSHDGNDQTFDIKSGNHLFETSSYLRNPYQASPSVNISNANDIELIDPAILAVGKGRLPSPSGVNNSGLDMRSNFHVQTPSFENDSRFQLLMQRSLSPHQNLRYTEPMDNFSPVTDAYGFTSRHMKQSQPSNLYPFPQFSLQQNRNTVASNGHWDGWSGVQAQNDIGVAELLRNDRLALNKFGMASSGDLYNRSFRM